MSHRTCAIDNCANPHKAKGWCNKHYLRWRKTGDPFTHDRPDTCTVDGCDNPWRGRGMCTTHLERERRGAEVAAPVNRPYSSVEESFRHRTERDGACLVWTGARNEAGYGRTGIAGRDLLAHRYAWERANGQIPEGMVIDHMCRNRACVEVSHLRLATPKQNAENLAREGTSNTGIRGVYRVGNRFDAKLGHNGEVVRLGVFSTLEEASEAIHAKRKELYTHYLA